MQTKTAIGVMAALLLASCAATTPAPRFSAVSPADEDGPEAGTPPPAPALASEPEAMAPATRGHEGHAPDAPATTSPEDQPYSCPMHPEVSQASPGSCPKCGMTLVRRTAAEGQP